MSESGYPTAILERRRGGNWLTTVKAHTYRNVMSLPDEQWSSVRNNTLLASAAGILASRALGAPWSVSVGIGAAVGAGVLYGSGVGIEVQKRRST